MLRAYNTGRRGSKDDHLVFFGITPFFAAIGHRAAGAATAGVDDTGPKVTPTMTTLALHVQRQVQV